MHLSLVTGALAISLCCLVIAARADSASADLPSLFIIGDSTVHNSTKGEQGWGEPIKEMFDPARIHVVNRAIGGRSSRTFRTEGRWKAVLAEAKPGDFILMQFGHNDPGALDDQRARGSLPGTGEQTQDIKKTDGSVETVHTYGWYMRQYIIEAKAKGVTPIVCSWIPHCPQPKAGKPATMPAIPVELTSYALWARQSADSAGAEFIDLNNIIWKHYAAYTADELKTRYFTPADYTHTNPDGAALNARCVVEGLLDDHSPLVKYLLPGKDNRD